MAQAADKEITGLTLASPNPGELVISWDTASPAPEDYRVMWAPSSGKFLSYKKENTDKAGNAYPTGTAHTVTGLPEGEEYKVRVRARYGDQKAGPWSDLVKLTVSAQPQPTPVPTETPPEKGDGGSNQPRSTNPPAKPTGLIAGGAHNSVLLSWTNPDDDSITGYQVLRGDAEDSLAVLTDDTGDAATTSYTDDSITAETTYVYAIRARNANGLSTQSDTVSATTLAPPTEQETASEDEPLVAERQSTTVDICSRTPEVQTAILAEVSGRTCSTVTDTDLASISELRVTDYSARSIDPADFAGLESVWFLQFLSGEITTVPARAFREMADTLEVLRLAAGRISSVHEDAFDGLSALRDLTVRGENDMSLPVGVFDGLTSLTRLNVGDHLSLPAHIFDGLSIDHLHLSVKDATMLDSDILDDLTGLSTLSIWSKDDVRGDLPVDLLEVVDESLTQLRLSVGFTDLPVGIFDGLTGLEGLDLVCNLLTELNLDRFDSFAATLLNLNIANNPFTTPPSETAIRAKFPNLVTLATGFPNTCRGMRQQDPNSDQEVSFGAATYTVAEGGSVTVTVELSGSSYGSVTIPLTATNQGGATDADYSGVPASVTFDSGYTSKTFTFSATDDSVDDDDESVLLGFGTLPAGVSEGTPATSTVSITDDDDPAVTVSFGAASHTVAEGDDVTVTVELSADPERSVTVPLTATNQGGATSGDYSGVPASVTFSSGDRSETFTFSATDRYPPFRFGP